MQKAQGCIVALIVASCAELAQAARICDQSVTIGTITVSTECSGSLLWAVLVGAISAALNLIFGAGLYFRQEMFKMYIPYFAIFLVLFWGFGVAVCTFDKPFTTTGNGYFATWGAAIISVYFCQISFVKFRAILGHAFTSALAGTLERRVAMIVMIFSYVCAFAVLTHDSGIQGAGALATNQETWGFACGMTCGGCVTIYMLLKSFTGLVTGKPKVLQYLSYFLTIMWLFGVGVLTFDYPFLTTGNGYFTAWGSFLGSIYLAYVTTMDPTTETPAPQ